MQIGSFKTADQSVQVDYDGVSIPIPRSTYENRRYKPDFDKLPLEDEYKAAQDPEALKEGLATTPRRGPRIKNNDSWLRQNDPAADLEQGVEFIRA